MCGRKERRVIAWLVAGVWELRGIKNKIGKGRCTLCLGERNVKNTVLKCSETGNWRTEFVFLNV
jgi:hypothetical protein